ncbi:MAG: hypothetical protein U5L98_02115 [Halomonas sp.]|nr:hypothetical protein [Halomonas sp.]MDZ7851460.1 hypothetical protein [Halomonas sp.]
MPGVAGSVAVDIGDVAQRMIMEVPHEAATMLLVASATPDG